MFTRSACFLSLLVIADLGFSQSPVELRMTNDQMVLLQAIAASDDPFRAAKACQRLAEIGDRRAIEPLAKLLSDPHLSNYARSALEGISGLEAKTALRESLSHLQGPLLAGALGSLGRLRDDLAVDSIEKYILHSDPSVSAAAGRALAQIATPRCAEILRSTFARLPKSLQHAHALSCLLCAQRFVQDKDPTSGQAMLDFLRANEVDDEIRLSVAVQSILAAGASLPVALVESIHATNPIEFLAALQAIRQIDGDRVAIAERLAEELPKMAVDRQVAMIRAIADLEPKAALTPIRELARTGPVKAKMEAVRLLAQQRDMPSLDSIFEAATSKDADLARAAQASVAVWPSEEIDSRIIAMLNTQDVNHVDAAILLCGLRRLSSAAPSLVAISKGPNESHRGLALEALGACGTLEELPYLLGIATQSSDTEVRRTAREAIRTACVRLPQSACSKAIDRAIAQASGESRVYLMEQLASVGGPIALASIAEAANGRDSETQDTATRLLGEWLTPDVAPILLQLSKSLSDDRYQLRAIRGAIRVARQLDMPLEDRIDICRETLSLSERPEETSLVLAVLKQYPSASGLEIISSLLDKPGSREATCAAGLAVAQKIYSKYPSETFVVLEKIASLTKSPETLAACKTLRDQLPSR